MADGFSENSLAQALVTLAGAITHNQSGQGIINAGETPGASTSIFPTSDAASATTGTPAPRVKMKIPAVHHLVEGIAS